MRSNRTLVRALAELLNAANGVRPLGRQGYRTVANFAFGWPTFDPISIATLTVIMLITFIESMDGEGPQGAKGVGEAPSICMAAAAANAIANATGTRLYELPFTPEKVYRGLKGQTSKRYWKPWKAE